MRRTDATVRIYKQALSLYKGDSVAILTLQRYITILCNDVHASLCNCRGVDTPAFFESIAEEAADQNTQKFKKDVLRALYDHSGGTKNYASLKETFFPQLDEASAASNLISSNKMYSTFQK